MTDELLAWYDSHARTLPWRGIHDAYRTWVSEIMLQQTRVDTVIPYYTRFLETYPTLEKLAAAPVEDVLKQWEGLGYYRRARNLHLGVQQVMQDFNGVVPKDPDILLSIHGIGRYTAGAIASIAYDTPVTAVDGNVIRVFSRYFGILEDTTRKDVLDRIDGVDLEHMNRSRPGDYNQAIMDLGATVCVPGTPDCEHCPLNKDCYAHLHDVAESLPVIPGKPQPKQLYYNVFLVSSPEGVLMKQRTEKMLEGLWVFPMADQTETVTASLKKLHLLPQQEPVYLGEARHVFTHQVWNMKVFFLTTLSPAPVHYRFIRTDELSSLTIPAAMKGPLKFLGKEKALPD